MTTETSVAIECTCGVITAEVHQCKADFRLWKGGKRLTSVSRIISAIMPTDFSRIPPDVLETAKLRGSQVDAAFCGLITGKIADYPLGTRDDSMRLVDKLVTWFDRQGFKSVQAQIVLGCHDHGGVLDLRLDGMVVDLKATSKVEESARLQVAAYADLACPATSIPASPAAILHVTERYADARLVPIVAQDYEDWRTTLAAWRMAQRRKPAKDED